MLAFDDGELWEGGYLITMVDSLVNDVPDENRVVDGSCDGMGCDVVKQRFGRHELLLVDEDEDEGLIRSDQLIQLA